MGTVRKSAITHEIADRKVNFWMHLIHESAVVKAINSNRPETVSKSSNFIESVCNFSVGSVDRLPVVNRSILIGSDLGPQKQFPLLFWYFLSHKLSGTILNYQTRLPLCPVQLHGIQHHRVGPYLTAVTVRVAEVLAGALHCGGEPPAQNHHAVTWAGSNPCFRRWPLVLVDWVFKISNLKNKNEW